MPFFFVLPPITQTIFSCQHMYNELYHIEIWHSQLKIDSSPIDTSYLHRDMPRRYTVSESLD